MKVKNNKYDNYLKKKTQWFIDRLSKTEMKSLNINYIFK